MPRFKLPSTLNVLMSLGVAALAWECWTIADPLRGNTFSAVLQKLGIEQPVIPAACGMLMRHLWGWNAVTRDAYHAGYAAGSFWWLVDKEDLVEAPAEPTVLPRVPPAVFVPLVQEEA